MTKVLTIAQQKGGAGKTSLVAHLGTYWAAHGAKVALIDVDPQGSLGAWWRERTAQGIANPNLSLVSASGWRLTGEVDRLQRQTQIILIDTPPHAETDSKMAVRQANLCLIPIQLSPMDYWATKPIVEVSRREKIPVLLVPNRTTARGRLGPAIRARLAADGLPVTTAELRNRTAYAASLFQGQGVAEAEPGGQAAADIQALASEILDVLESASAKRA
ncbi:ParA family partition ATPase [Zavarzinia sp. CC-PAN008]|uniref:ParA family partition ATPase n=1 Tax=Zavarzinia sp. CC-PAN008 TaxID=3243332 RepID=UPI003F744556